MNIYIVFGDKPTATGENIKRIFFNKRIAENYLDFLRKYEQGDNYHMEEFNVRDKVPKNAV